MYAATGNATRTAVPTSAIITRRSDKRNLELLTRAPFRVPGRVDYQRRTEISARKIQDALTAVKHFPPSRSHFLRMRRNGRYKCVF